MNLLVLDDFLGHRKEKTETSFLLNLPGAEGVHTGKGGTPLPENCISPGAAARKLANGAYKVIVFGAPLRLWNPRKVFYRNLGNLLRNIVLRGGACFAAGRLLRIAKARGIPIIGIDGSDRMILDNSRFPIIEAAQVFFKRELPTNPINAFLYTTDKTEDTGNLARIPYFRQNSQKFRPLSLGISDALFDELQAYKAPAKEIDILFVGAVKNRPMRAIGAAVLEKLRGEGWNIVVSDKKLKAEEYYALVAKARISWSPEGFGFDCYRTYEVAALGSVPLLKTPPIIEYEPFTDGQNAIYYRHEAFDFEGTVRRALARPHAELEQMGERARQHILEHHTSTKRAAHVLQSIG
jgi:hypothetical protein